MNKISTKSIRVVPSNIAFSQRMNKKGFMPQAIGVAAVIGISAVAIWAHSALTADSDNETKVVTNQAESVVYKLNAIDANNKESGVSFLAGPITAIGTESGKQSSTLTADSTVTEITANLGESVQFIAEPTGYYASEVTKSSTSATTALEIEASKYSTPELSVLDVETNSVVGTWSDATKTLTIPNPALVAGGASKTYTLRAKVNDINSQFGQTGLLMAADAKSSKYDVGSSMASLGSAGLTGSMTDSEMKQVFSLEQTSINSDSGLVNLGSVTIKLKTGQSADAIAFELYDKANFLSVDGKTVKNGVEKDGVTNVDNGAENAKIVFLNS